VEEQQATTTTTTLLELAALRRLVILQGEEIRALCKAIEPLKVRW
jgi:hypothetical protein